MTARLEFKIVMGAFMLPATQWIRRMKRAGSPDRSIGSGNPEAQVLRI
jgi:hypothetical protein